MSKNNLLKYNGYFGTVEYSYEDKCLWGKVQFINDVITYESDSAENIQKEFESAVDDYLEFCAEVGKEPDKTMTGSFNVRIGAELHKKALIKAKQENISLNDIIKKAIERYVSAPNEVHNHVNVSIHKHENSSVITQSFDTASAFSWKPALEEYNGSH